MIVPTRRAVLLLAGGFPIALLPALAGASLWPVWAAALAIVVAGLATELLLGLPARRVELAARPPTVLYVGEQDSLVLEVRSPLRRPIEFELLCDFDETLEPQELQRGETGLTPWVLGVPLVPLRRGTAHVRGVWLRWRGPLGLFQWTAQRPLQAAMPVLPNVRAVRGAAVRFFSSRQFLSGLKVQRHLGDGSEFEALREHRAGFDARAIDWKASARHRKLLSREFRAERNHGVVLAVDQGRLMSEPMLGIPKVDHAINASLLLAYVSLKTGDRVGLCAFDDGVRVFSEPQGGVHSFARIQRATAEIDYSQAETNFTLCLLELERRLSRRSLVVVLTDFVDTVTAELMIENLTRLGRRHLAVFVALRDPALDTLAGAEPRGLDDLNRAVTAHELVRERHAVLGRLRRQGVHCIDGAPSEISPRLIDHYLEVKRRELV